MSLMSCASPLNIPDPTKSKTAAEFVQKMDARQSEGRDEYVAEIKTITGSFQSSGGKSDINIYKLCGIYKKF